MEAPPRHTSGDQAQLPSRRIWLKSAAATLASAYALPSFVTAASGQNAGRPEKAIESKMVGFMLAHEQFTVPQVIDIGVSAEQAGFDLLATSDHFQPWQANEGRGFPQSATAHDTFWDFISLTPESMHMVMWIMSDRTLPRSLRMIEGFGIHSFRLINAAGESTFVKFHWRPKLGLQSTIWDETVKISGADPDFHRRDMFDAIAAGDFPEWEFAVQLFTQEEADAFPFDHLDATKLIPEELVPLKVIGRMVLDRWPNNFFAETEQVAYCPSHIVPGIDFSNDPLLQGRLFSYQDTQLSRLGSPNFHQIPVNAPKCPFS